MVDFFLREYNIFIVLISCLLHSKMAIQSYTIHRRDKIHKKIERDKTGKVRCIHYKYRRQLMLTATV